MPNVSSRPSANEITAAIDEIEQLILQRFPEALFHIESDADDPDTTVVIATVDVDNGYEVLDLVTDRVVGFQIEGLPIVIVPMRPQTRILANLQAQQRLPETLEFHEPSPPSTPLA